MIDCHICNKPVDDPDLTYKGKPTCKSCWWDAGYTPNYTKAEFHLTYNCTLACRACSRACFLVKPHTENMTYDDINEFMKQAGEINFKPGIIMIGGEPTIHPDFLKIVEKTKKWNENFPDGGNYVQIYSNGFTPKSRDLCLGAKRMNASIFKDEWKNASRRGDEDGPEWDLNMYVSPKDAGLPYKGKCYCHSSAVCGLGVDHNGYSICPIGLFFAALQPDLKDTITKDLKNCFNEEWAKKATIKQCEVCGFMYHKRHGVSNEDIAKFKAYAATCPIINGMPMSPYWANALKDKPMKGCKK